MSGLGIPEETVKYLVNRFNDEVKELSSSSLGNQEIDKLQEAAEGMSAIWNTVGGIAKIKGLTSEIAELNTSKIIAAVQQLTSTQVQYTKNEVLEKTIEKLPY